MSGWLTHAAAFLLGAGVGGLSYAWYVALRDPRQLLRRLYKDSPRFFDELRQELGKPEFKDVREFAILESSRATFVSENLRFVYSEEDIPELKRIGIDDIFGPGMATETLISYIRENIKKA